VLLALVCVTIGDDGNEGNAYTQHNHTTLYHEYLYALCLWIGGEKEDFPRIIREEIGLGGGGGFYMLLALVCVTIGDDGNE